MAKHLIDLIPEGDEFKILRDILFRLSQDFPDKYEGLGDARINKWIKQIEGGRDADEIRDDIVTFVITEEDAIERYGISSEEFDQLVLGENEGGINFGDLEVAVAPDTGVTDVDPATLPGVLAGGETIKVTVDGQDRFYQIYEFPAGSGQFVSYQFNDLAQLEATLGKSSGLTVHAQGWFEVNVIAEADAESVIGLGGSFTGFTEEIMKDAAAAAGITDPSLIGQIVSDPEMQAIMAKALLGNWTPAQILAEQRNTDFWKNVLYPGIEQFYGKTGNPEAAWLNYRAQIEPALRQLGYVPDANGSFDSQIQEMLGLNIDAGIFNSMVPTFVLATQNAEFATILNAWIGREDGDLAPVDFGDWFALIAGESQPELEAVVEKAQLAFEAQRAGVEVTEQQIIDLAERTELSQAQAITTFAEMSRTLLALGDKGLARGNLTRDDLISAFAGTAPTSGRTIEEVKLRVAKLAREQDLFDEEKINFFVGFSPLGTPQRPGLKTLAPESA